MKSTLVGVMMPVAKRKHNMASLPLSVYMGSLSDSRDIISRETSLLDEEERVAKTRTYSEPISFIKRKRRIQEGHGVYIILHLGIPVYIGRGIVNNRVPKFIRVLKRGSKGTNPDHIAAMKARSIDADSSNYSFQYIILDPTGNSLCVQSRTLEKRLIAHHKILGEAIHNDESAAGV